MQAKPSHQQQGSPAKRGVVDSPFQRIEHACNALVAATKHLPPAGRKSIYRPFSSEEIPQITLARYAHCLARRMEHGDAGLLLGMCLLLRIWKTHDAPPPADCHHRLLITCTVIAMKSHCDDFYKNKYMAKIGGMDGCKELAELERYTFLKLLRCTAVVRQRDVRELLEHGILALGVDLAKKRVDDAAAQRKLPMLIDAEAEAIAYLPLAAPTLAATSSPKATHLDSAIVTGTSVMGPPLVVAGSPLAAVVANRRNRAAPADGTRRIGSFRDVSVAESGSESSSPDVVQGQSSAAGPPTTEAAKVETGTSSAIIPALAPPAADSAPSAPPMAMPVPIVELEVSTDESSPTQPRATTLPRGALQTASSMSCLAPTASFKSDSSGVPSPRKWPSARPSSFLSDTGTDGVPSSNVSTNPSTHSSSANMRADLRVVDVEASWSGQYVPVGSAASVAKRRQRVDLPEQQ